MHVGTVEHRLGLKTLEKPNINGYYNFDTRRTDLPLIYDIMIFQVLYSQKIKLLNFLQTLSHALMPVEL